MTTDNKQIKVALIQQSYKGSKHKMIQDTKQKIGIASNNADLVVLQELHQNEYFCQTCDPKYFEYADDFDKDKQIWSEVAKEYGVVLVTSLFEKRTPGLYHNTAVVFDSDGSEAGISRKAHIPDDPGYYEKFYFTPGDSCGINSENTPIQTSIGKLGVATCFSQWFPEQARLMTLAGADILVYPTAIGWEMSDTEEEKTNQLNAWITIQRSHAIANGVPVISCNRVGFENNNVPKEQGTKFWGNSFVCGPQGELLAKVDTEEEIIYTTIDLTRTEKVRQIWSFLRDRRIDMYSDLTKRWID